MAQASKKKVEDGPMAAGTMQVRLDKDVVGDLKIYAVLGGTRSHSDTVRWLMDHVTPDLREAFRAIETVRKRRKKP